MEQWNPTSREIRARCGAPVIFYEYRMIRSWGLKLRAPGFG